MGRTFNSAGTLALVPGRGWAGSVYPYSKSAQVLRCPDDATPPTIMNGVSLSPVSMVYNINLPRFGSAMVSTTFWRITPEAPWAATAAAPSTAPASWVDTTASASIPEARRPRHAVCSTAPHQRAGTAKAQSACLQMVMPSTSREGRSLPARTPAQRQVCRTPRTNSRRVPGRANSASPSVPDSLVWWKPCGNSPIFRSDSTSRRKILDAEHSAAIRYDRTGWLFAVYVSDSTFL